MVAVKTLCGLVAVILAWSWGSAAAAQKPPAYAYYEIGDVAAPTPAATRQAMMLMGGGEWPRDAFRWFTERAGHGHIVVLRASGAGDAGEEIYRDVGGVLSVQTIVFSDRAAASDPQVLDILRKADGIFLAGGDQANYVRFWKDTPVAQMLNAHVRKGRPIAGTSAGLAILGGTAYGAMDGGSIDSPTALADPAGPAVPPHAAPRVCRDRHPFRRARPARPADRVRRGGAAARSARRGHRGRRGKRALRRG
jgi:cyanophycinase-like exopeptidase